MASTAFFAPLAALNKMVDTMYLLDERLVSIDKVMDNANLSEVFENATEAAYTYGRTIDGALKSLGEISKLGYNQQDAQALNNNAMLLSTVGEFKDDAEAAEYLVAIMKQYKMEIADTAKVVDSLNSVSNQTGADTLGLAQALSKSSSSASLAEVSFDDLSGMISNTIEVLKIGGNEAGTFYKALFSRYLRSSTQNDIEAIGVATKTTTGELRSATDVLQDIGKKWNELSSVEQNALAESLGGGWHVNKVISLLENQENVLKNTTFSIESYGSATKELETFQGGLQYKTNQMIASFQELTMAISQNGARDALVGLIESVTFITRGFTELTEVTDGWNLKLPILIGLVWGGVKAFGALKLAIMGVRSSFGIFSLGIVALETIASMFMSSAKASEINSKALQDNAQKTSSQTAELERLISKYEELTPQAKNSAEKQEELHSVLGQIQQLAPHLIESTGKYGDALTLNRDKADLYIESLKEMTKEQLNQASIANTIELSNVEVEIDDEEKKLKKLESSTKDSIDTLESYWEKYDVRGIADAEEDYYKRREKIADKANEAFEDGNKDLYSELTIQLTTMLNEWAEYDKLMRNSDGLKEYSDQVAKLEELRSKKSGIEERSKALDEISKGTKENTDANNENTESIQGAESALSGYNDEATDGLSAQDELNKRIQDAKDNFSELASIVDELTKTKQHDQAVSLATNEAYSALSDELSPINELMEKMAEGKSISAAEAMNLIQQEEELADAIKIENGMISINEKAVIDLRDAKVASYKVMLDAQNKELNAQKQALLAKLGFNKAEIEGIKTVAQARIQALNTFQQAQNKALAELRKNNPLAAYGAENKYWSTSPVDDAMSSLAPILEAQESIAKLSEMASQGLTQVGTSMEDLSKAQEKANKEQELSAYIAEQYALKLAEVNSQLETQQKLQQKFSNWSSKYRNAIKQEIKLLEQKAKLLEQQSSSLQSQISSGYIQPTGIVTTSGGNYTSSSSGSYSGKYDSYINQAASKYGVDPNLIAAIIKQESNFNPNARSGAGAMGLMQLMPGTASGLGVTNAYDPYQNIMGGTKYIAEQLAKFGGDIQKALYAYNAGAGNVSKILASSANSWKEPKNYADKVLANYKSYTGQLVSTVSTASQSVADYYLNNFRVTTEFSEKDSLHPNGHKGLDLANGKQGDPVKALRGGKVITATYSDTAGYWVVVQQDDGKVAKYMHMQKGLDVKAGQNVTAGQKLGEVGNTGRSTGAHLHLQIEQNGTPIDPQAYLNGLQSTGSSGDASKAAAQNAQAVDQAMIDVLQLGQDVSGIRDQIQALQLELVNSFIAGFEYQKSTFDDDIAKAEYLASLHTEWSMTYRKHEREKLGALEAQKAIHQQEIDFIKAQIATNMQLSTAQRDALSATLREKEIELYSYASAIREVNMEIKQSGMDEHIKKANDEYAFLTDRVENLNRKMSLLDDEEDQDLKLEYLKQQATWIEKQREQAAKNVEELRKERKVVEDFPDLVRQIDEEIKNWEQSTADLHVEMSNVQNEIEDIYNTIADEIIDIYKEVYEAQRKEAIKAIDDEMDAYRKAHDEKMDMIDKEENDRDYNKDLADRQKEIAELEKQINDLSMDDSLSAQSKKDDLQEQLAEKQESLDEFTHDRQIELQKDSLQEDLSNREEAMDKEKEQIETHYDNLINDEREWAKMREDILAGNLTNMTADMTEFKEFVTATMDEVGKSISLNLIDRIGEAQDLFSDLETTNKPTSNEQFYYQGERVDVNRSDFDWDEYAKYKEAYVTALEDTEIFTLKNGKLEATGEILKKGKRIRAYGRHGGVNAYGLGGNEWVQADGRQVKYERFASGGFTNNSEGLAWLDKKEIVLKDTDTSNFLKAIDITRDLFNKLPKLTLPQLYPSMAGASNSPNIQNLVHIENFNGTKAEIDNLAKTLTNKLTKLGVRPKL